MFIPSVIQLVHVYENHEHTICTSKEVKHIHAQGLDCNICFYSSTKAHLTDNLLTQTIVIKKIVTIVKPYNFLKNHHKLSFSLRGPPLNI